MSYALETKKRKFTRVLESISKPLTPSDGTTKAAKDPITAARERLAAPASIKRVRVGNDAVTSKTTASQLPRVSSTSSSVRPNFVPWDRERFLERLETFRPVTRWSSKPAPINEVEWAKRGWSCTDYMRVACVGGCGATLVVKLPDETDDFEDLDSDKVQERREVRERVVEEYRKMIQNGHKENCPWRNNACDATIHRLALSNPETAISTLRDRYLKVAGIYDQLPASETIELPDQVILSDIINILPPDFLDGKFASKKGPSESDEQNSNPDGIQTIDEKAFAFAFFGWDVVKDGSSGLLECRACFRRLGLWLYKPKEDGKEAVYDKLAVHNEHMEYCPWIDGKAQSGTGKSGQRPEDLLSGWQVLAQDIRTKHRRHLKSIGGSSAETPSRDSDASSFDTTTAEDDAAQKAKDREWWSKLRRMRDVLHVKGPKKNISEK